MITYTNYLLRLIIVATSEDEIAKFVNHPVRALLYHRKFCIFPPTGNVLVMLISCSCHFLAMFCLCSTYVLVTFLSCSCHLHIMFFFHFLVMFLSCCCHVKFLSRWFHVFAMFSSRAWQDCARSLKDLVLTCTILIETWQNHDIFSIESLQQDQEMMLNLDNHSYLQLKPTN